jgi:hypothetical protein
MAFNQGLYNQVIAMGGSHASAMNVGRAKKPGRALRRFQRDFIPPPPAAQAPPPMPTFTPPRLDQQMASNIGQSESGVQSARKKRGKRTNLASLKINLNPSAKPFGNVGTGLNIGALT